MGDHRCGLRARRNGDGRTSERVRVAIVDRNLEGMFSPGRSAGELYSHYTSFGDDPFIRPAVPGKKFSAWDYAEHRCRKLCHDHQ